MVLNIKYFGKLAEIAGDDSKIIDTDVSSLDLLITNLGITNPELKKEIYAIFVNNKKVDNTDITLNENDEICLMPPFAGG